MPRAPKTTALAKHRKPRLAAAAYEVALVAEDGAEEVIASRVARGRASALARAVQRGVPAGIRVVARPVVARTDTALPTLERLEPAFRAAAELHKWLAPTYEAGRRAEPAAGPLTRRLIGALVDSPVVRQAAVDILQLIAPSARKETA